MAIGDVEILREYHYLPDLALSLLHIDNSCPASASAHSEPKLEDSQFIPYELPESFNGPAREYQYLPYLTFSFSSPITPVQPLRPFPLLAGRGGKRKTWASRRPLLESTNKPVSTSISLI